MIANYTYAYDDLNRLVQVGTGVPRPSRASFSSNNLTTGFPWW
ncbi:hypothetical protein [Desulfobulbus elongatus]|nr:hypothetical protein [Desulfobulbus elongatus]